MWFSYIILLDRRKKGMFSKIAFCYSYKHQKFVGVYVYFIFSNITSDL
jgi:hypothetical protein